MNRRGTVLIIVAGLAALMASLALTFLARVRSDVEEGQLQLQMVQARVMLVAACSYIQEASRIGWDIQGYDVAPEHGTAERPPAANAGSEHAEAFGWIDVRDGTLGPRIRTMDPTQVQPLSGSRPQDEATTGSPTSGSSRFPIGVPVRFDLTVPTVAPYAISMRATYNPVETTAPDNGRAYLRYPDPQPPFTWNNWTGTRAAPAGTVSDANLSRWLEGDMTPRAGTTGRCWFRLVREASGAVFTVTCGAGGTRGFRSWDEVESAGAEEEFFGDRSLFAVMQSQEVRLWYRVEWSPATTVIDMNFLREHEEHTFRVGTPTHVGGNPDNGYSGQQMAPNMGGTIQWIQRLRQEPTVW